ncbi:MAG: ABC transporter ATP-binding protein/permease [Clostridiales Family XIII bacterium]|jgi:ATP-binding cassette subfamily B protein|nr:ABC transporter ATP-binding protein/permease [Clostridiales Family XIII bacterium]
MSDTNTNTKPAAAGHTRHTRQRRHRGPGGFGGGPPGVTTEKAKDFKGTAKALVRYLAKFKISIFIVAAFAVVSTVFNVIGPKILANAITEMFNGIVAKYTAGGAIDFDKIWGILMMLIALYFVSAIFGGAMGWIMSGVTQKVGYEMRARISEKIHRMPMKYFESNSTGDVLSRITNDVDTLTQGLNQSITQIISSTATLVGVIIMMLSISPLMTIIAFVMLPISFGLIALIMKFSQKYFNRQQKYLGKVNGQVEETISGLNIVKLYNHEQAVKDEFTATNDILFGSAWKSQFFSGLMMPVINFVGNLGYVGVAIFGGMLAFKGTIAVGDIQAFIQYVRNFQQPIQMFAQVSNMLQSTAASAERVFEFLDEEEESPDAADAAEVDGAEGRVCFEHVRFGYDPEKIIVGDFEERVEPGMTVAIVGPTGAGKTTMVKLLMRFYDVNSGSITLDGHDIRNITRRSLRHNFGMVLQDTWLFKGTIMENIRYGRQDASDEEIYEAARAAHADHFIRTLPGGYDMVLTEDAENISQGQRQLLTIARAILADSPILILDEATSSVDTRTEGQIQKAMNNLKKGRTSFVIAHRLSTIRDADLILVMNKGDVIEQGTHDELLAAGGFYADLYNSQFDPVEVAV